MKEVEFPAGAERSDPLSGRHEREARSRVLFREVNERIEETSVFFGVDGPDSLVCECGNPDCGLRIDVSRDEYELVRAHASRFLVAPNHENPETETIVEQNERFVVVETVAGVSSRIARETDPRSQTTIRRHEERHA